MISSYFKIEILAIQDEFVLLGHKGLSLFNIQFGVLENRYTSLCFILNYSTSSNKSIN